MATFKYLLMKKILLILFLLIGSKTFSQEPVFATISGGDLYSFDLSNCTRRFIGSTGQAFGDIAFTPDGQLWGIISGFLYHVDTTTANATLIGNMGVQCVSLVGLNDTTLLVESGNNLYSVNTNTALSTYIDTIGYQASGDLTWYDDDLYMVTSMSGIIRIVLNSTYSAIISTTLIGTNLPSCEGAITATFPGDYNSIVGFSGPDLIKICQLDGSYQMLCPALNIAGTPGGASIRLATQVPQPSVCHIPAPISEISIDNFNFEFFPNPVINELNIKSMLQGKVNINILNSLGQRIISGIISENVSTLNLSKFKNGMYYVELTNEKHTTRLRFVVEK